MKGIYILVIKLEHDADIRIGKLGLLNFKKGFYAYVGSALGKGGFKRVTRHFNVASGINTTRKWHIDYLLPVSEVMCAILLGEDDIECDIAESMKNFHAIPGFGCSDCSCKSHLFFAKTDFKDRIIDITGNESIIIIPHI